MIRKKIFNIQFLIIACLLYIQSSTAQVSTAQYKIIPYPASLEAGKGKFVINGNTALAMQGEFLGEKQFLNKLLGSYLGKSLVQGTSKSANTIVLKYDPAIKSVEGYTLEVNSRQVVLSAKAHTGMFYALQTLRQLLPDVIEKQKGRALSLSAVKIADQPKFGWRGMMLDVSRHFFSIDYLKKYVDMMALYKMNKLHLHLTDDQGWRIEIKKYPLLTQIGAWRTLNNQDSACMKIAKETGNTDFEIDKKHLVKVNGETKYGGFYTQKEMKEFIKYAQDRSIEVIPEIDMPGHMMAAARAYPFLTCDSTLGDGRGFSNPICPCNPDVTSFAKDVYAEIAEIFPSRYMHIGGDEVEKRNWAKSAACKALMKEMGYTELSQIQNHFTREMKAFFESKGKIMIGWDEISEAGIDSGATVMFWRSWAPLLPGRAAAQGSKVIMSPSGPLYFDATPDLNTLKEVYNYNPFGNQYKIPAGAEHNIIGVQANLWTEMIPTEERADYMIMPRMTALSELGWSSVPDVQSYLERLYSQFKRLDDLGINYRMPDIPGLVEQNVFVRSTHYFKKSPLPHFTIRYTTDGTLPTAKSLAMGKPVLIDKTLTLTLALFTPSGRRGDVSVLKFSSDNYQKASVIVPAKAGLNAQLFKKSYSKTTELGENPDSNFIAKNISVPTSVNDNQFGLRFSGYIHVPQTGIYSFYLNSDDGAILYVNDKMLVDNDGLHPAKEKGAEIALEKGYHKLKLNYIDGGGGNRLELKYSIGNEVPKPVPLAWYSTEK